MNIKGKDMSRRILRILPNNDCGLNWKLEEDGKTLFQFVKKKDAINKAKELISSQIVVHGKDGKIQKEYTYGLDPAKMKG